ncbi:hypothetical protein F5X98DRAFT_212972 [Xylaria grammica]|nr:hypothetical protein F5X98DRAFT_212972 [Xylaria grammica]
MCRPRSETVQACTLVDDTTSTDTAMKPSSAPLARNESCTPPINTKPTRRRLRPPVPIPICPQPGSLYDILHDHAGLPLFVRPLAWTDLHAKVLGCRFLQLPPHEPPTPPSSCSSSSSFLLSPQTPLSPQSPPTTASQSIAAFTRGLNYLMSADKPDINRTNTLATILKSFYPKTLGYPQFYSDLDMRFGPCYYSRVARCQLLYNPIYAYSTASQMSFDSSTTCTPTQSATHWIDSSPFAPNEPAMLAYISRSHLSHARRTGYNIMSGPKGTFNHPVHRLQVLRSKTLLPQNADEDSYFVAVMVAMAQKSVYPDIKSSQGFAPRDVKVHLVTVAEEEHTLIAYTATVPAALLSMFHEPDVAPTGNSEIRIEYSHVPVWPVPGLNERLGKALGFDIVGNFDVNLIYNFDEDNLPAWETGSSIFRSTPPKRKRSIFSEVANTSFSENRDSDRLKDMFPKKRRAEKTSDAPSGPLRSKTGSRRCERRETGIVGVVQ